MSNYYYQPSSSAPEDETYSIDASSIPHTSPPQQYAQFQQQFLGNMMPQQQYYSHPSQYSPQPTQYHQMSSHQYQMDQQQSWVQPTVPSSYPFPQQDLTPFPQYNLPDERPTAGPSRMSTGYLSPGEAVRTRPSRSPSYTSNASSSHSVSRSDISRSVSPNASEMAKWGFKNEDGSWSCSYPGCSSRSTFHRGCDLRKHYKRHTKSLFCRHDGCPQATEGGFSSKKDRARHEAKHNPNILCEWEGCERLFSRQDNMKDHVRRVHKRRLT